MAQDNIPILIPEQSREWCGFKVGDVVYFNDGYRRARRSNDVWPHKILKFSIEPANSEQKHTVCLVKLEGRKIPIEAYFLTKKTPGMNIKQAKEEDIEAGYYHIYSPVEAEPCLVHGYFCSDYQGRFVFGFNRHDGGGILPLHDLKYDTVIVKVSIVEQD